MLTQQQLQPEFILAAKGLSKMHAFSRILCKLDENARIFIIFSENAHIFVKIKITTKLI